MAIVKMKKISTIGLSSIKSSLIKELMDLGVVEISAQDSKLTDPEWISYVKKDGNEVEVLDCDAKISKINEVLNSLEKYDKSKKPMFFTRKSISSKDFENAISELSKTEENVAKVLDMNKSFNELSSEENKIETAILSLKPWASYEIPLELTETKYTSIFTGVVPNIVDVEKLKSDLREKTDRCIANLVGSDKDQHYFSIICLIKEKDDVYEILKQYGFNTVAFKDLKGTAAQNIVQYENNLKEISENKSEVEKNITDYVPYKEQIQLFYDYLVIERDKNKILGNLLNTDSTFYIEGWIPEVSKEQIENVLNKHQCWFEIYEPEEGEQTPIAMQNNSFTQPFEAITELYSLPSSSNIDPTPYMAPFYCLFFGLMLADVGYGLIMAAATYMVLKKFKLEGSIQKLMRVFFYCGISTAFWGVMFGSWFGDAIPAAARLLFNSDFTVKPLWLNPMEQPMTLLIVSFVFGIIHLFTGMAVKAHILIRDGNPLDALFDIGFWYGLIIGLILLLFGNTVIPGSGQIGKWMSIIFALGLVLTQGRAKKNIAGKLISGVLSLYNITSYLSDVLSYSRLLALGLATGVVSSVMSILGSMGGRNVFGILLFVVVMIIGHTFNFAINALGAFVHAARLQYVEFFGKFYEGGGEPFKPFTKKTKYNRIIKEEI
ncbi:MAG: V-type ATP synthase subunit I [Sedimentibacter saalensis]|uniref:V/A-type H+-transporting ATPase subunit I n=1 Tax=Sedimentibacter saalensis TaxID=130788 RepID=A0A562J474_9FIRM|nr:V-type ATP synthase subunit I [Sedimentibacter saalensis]MEA5094901.1 V-type ATP synthase subunit I [Sedimentibacter saalensis]TWH77962.1 V/A-type H+-transporting ATPase subunit I [Sedimentibacter saalensis]